MYKKWVERLSPLFAVQLTINTVKEFFQEKSLFHGAALAYYAIIALVPILYLAVNYVGMLLGNDTMIEIITEALHDYVGISDVSGILTFLSTVDFEKGSFVLNLVSIIVLLISSSALLNSLRESINQFYDVEANYSNKKNQFIRTLLAKLISIVLMTGIGVVVIVFYFAETVLLSISENWLSGYDTASWLLSKSLHQGIAIGSNVIIFLFIFKFLHDGIVKWRVAFRGAIFTGLLLYLGQILIKFYVINYFFGSGGGVAGTLFVILVWIYYSSQIIFLGAKFTKVYGDLTGVPIQNRTF
jgi:membrane protein